MVGSDELSLWDGINRNTPEVCDRPWKWLVEGYYYPTSSGKVPFDGLYYKVLGRAKVEIVQFLFDHTVPQTLQLPYRSPPKNRQVRGRCLRQKSQRLWVSHHNLYRALLVEKDRWWMKDVWFLVIWFQRSWSNMWNLWSFFLAGGPSDVLCEMFFPNTSKYHPEV